MNRLIAIPAIPEPSSIPTDPEFSQGGFPNPSPGVTGRLPKVLATSATAEIPILRLDGALADRIQLFLLSGKP